MEERERKIIIIIINLKKKLFIEWMKNGRGRRRGKVGGGRRLERERCEKQLIFFFKFKNAIFSI